MPAMRVCREWGSLLLDEKTTVACSAQECTDRLGSFLPTMNFWGRAQETIVCAFGLGTGAFAIWMDTGRKSIKIRHYDARMVVPLAWDSEGVRECAFVTRAFVNGEAVDQLQMHVVGSDDAYQIRTVCFDKDGREVSVAGVAPEVSTGSTFPTFGIVRSAVPNTRVDFSPYGQSVDLAYDALINEIDAGKMRVFLSDVMFDQEKISDGRRVPIPFGKGRLHSVPEGHVHGGHDHRVRAGIEDRGPGEGVQARAAGARGPCRAGRRLLQHRRCRVCQDRDRGVERQQRAHEEHTQERERAAGGAG